MSNTRVALALTALYWLAAAVWALVTPTPGWIDLRWVTAIGLGAIPATVLIWLVWLCFRIAGARRRPVALGVVGILLPIACFATAQVAVEWMQQRYRDLAASQIAAARISDIVDEPLLSAAGNMIGVRVTYRVAFPKGLVDGKYAPQVNLNHPNPATNFELPRQSVTPPFSHPIVSGTYVVTIEYRPYFLPQFLMFPELAASSDPALRCLRWGGAKQREQYLPAAAQRLSISIQDYLPAPVQTARSYRLADFYEGALKEGGRECNVP